MSSERSRALAPAFVLSALAMFALAQTLTAVPCARAEEPVAAAAEEPVAVAPEAQLDEQAYRELIQQALHEFKLRNWPEARVLFRRAHAQRPSARTYRGIGVVSYEMRDYVAAVMALSSALADSRQVLDERQRHECESLLARARTFLGSYALVLAPAETRVVVDGGPPHLDADGRLLLTMGEHQLRASAPGHDEATLTLQVQGGEQDLISLSLTPSTPAPAPPAVAALTEPSPTKMNQAAPAPARRRLPSEPVPERGGVRYSWIPIGAAAALGASAAGVWVRGKRELDELDESCARAAANGPPCLPGTVDTQKLERFEKVTNALLGATGAAVVAAAVSLAFEWPRSPGERKLALELSPQRVSLRGSF